MLERQVQEMRELPERITRLESQLLQLRQESRDEVSSIREEFKSANEETRHFMRILHEDVLARIEVMGEGDDPTR